MDGSSGRVPVRSTTALPRWLLLAGLLAGAGLAASGLVTLDSGRRLPPQAVARINDRLILRDAWLRAVAAVAGERRGELTDADRRHILDRLVDEELLVQHGLDDSELQRFYAENTAFFVPASRVRVKAWRLAADGTRSEFQPSVPDSLLPLAKVQAYLGPALTAQAAALDVDRVSSPIATQSGDVVLQVLEKEPGAVPAFEQIRDQVRSEFKRRSDEAAVRGLLEKLRREARLTVQPDPA